ncbi:MAG TPA: hypothetical protein VGC15_21160, partial [Acetobacteraceae bacterium]
MVDLLKVYQRRYIRMLRAWEADQRRKQSAAPQNAAPPPETIEEVAARMSASIQVARIQVRRSQKRMKRRLTGKAGGTSSPHDDSGNGRDSMDARPDHRARVEL